MVNCLQCSAWANAYSFASVYVNGIGAIWVCSVYCVAGAASSARSEPLSVDISHRPYTRHPSLNYSTSTIVTETMC